ncbi:jg21050 [Pararge aegeria aegeria]|uniref:Jg21050 protein n=1 Tax=Pararge aegeria aegeria TaxID=348720 RepID=A0A8S4RQH1_9NEOP|nr:jg21050 [Pararge aegeria aegeria]
MRNLHGYNCATERHFGILALHTTSTNKPAAPAKADSSYNMRRSPTGGDQEGMTRTCANHVRYYYGGSVEIPRCPSQPLRRHLHSTQLIASQDLSLPAIALTTGGNYRSCPRHMWQYCLTWLLGLNSITVYRLQTNKIDPKSKHETGTGKHVW